MKFEEALAAMREGKKVRRKCWKLVIANEQTIYINNNNICMSTNINVYEMIKVPSEWILAEDWKIVDE